MSNLKTQLIKYVHCWTTSCPGSLAYSHHTYPVFPLPAPRYSLPPIWLPKVQPYFEQAKILPYTHAVTTQIFLWHTLDIRSDSAHLTLCDGCGVCPFSDTLHPTQPSVPMISLLLQLKYLSNIPQTSGWLQRLTWPSVLMFFLFITFHLFLLPDLFS